VVYLDNDAVMLSHLRALAVKGNPSVTVVDGDVSEVATSLDAVAAGIDLSAPACLLMGFLLHFFEPDAARDLVARYVAALAPGSYVVLSVGRADAEAAKAGFSTYSSGAAQVYNGTAELMAAEPVQLKAAVREPAHLIRPVKLDGLQCCAHSCRHTGLQL
jgi:O-methyltransferase involved in polyketide biosynthesis